MRPVRSAHPAIAPEAGPVRHRLRVCGSVREMEGSSLLHCVDERRVVGAVPRSTCRWTVRARLTFDKTCRKHRCFRLVVERRRWATDPLAIASRAALPAEQSSTATWRCSPISGASMRRLWTPGMRPRRRAGSHPLPGLCLLRRCVLRVALTVVRRSDDTSGFTVLPKVCAETAARSGPS